MIIGQAPGVVEGLERRPWRGRAGRTLRQWLELDEDAFYRTFYCASVTRCYPGKGPSGRGDRMPSREEQHLCRFWLESELELLSPQLVLVVGVLATRRVLGGLRLTDRVGVPHAVGPAVAIPLPHPSGASAWLNSPENRHRLEEALRVVRRELDRLGT